MDRRNRFLIFFLPIAFIVSLMGTLFFWLQSSSTPSTPLDQQEERIGFFLKQLKPEHLEDGNLIFVRKPGIWGDISQAFSPKDQRYTHVGMIANNLGQATVIHADGDPLDPQGQVREESLESFLQLAQGVGIYRFTFSKEQKHQMVEKARSYVKKAFKFNSQFRLGQPDAFYCTELVWHLAKEVSGRDLVPQKRIQWQQPYIGLDDLTINPFLRETLAIRWDNAKN